MTDPINSAEKCRQEGWGPGTVVEGDEGYGPTRVIITAVGETNVLGRVITQSGIEVSASEGLWGFLHRDWREVKSGLDNGE